MQALDPRLIPSNISMAVSEAQAKYTVHVEAFLIHYREYPGGGICTQFIRANSELEALRLAKEYIPRSAIVERVTHCNHARNAIYQDYLREQDMERERKRKAEKVTHVKPKSKQDAYLRKLVRDHDSDTTPMTPRPKPKPKSDEECTSTQRAKRKYLRKVREQVHANLGHSPSNYLSVHMGDLITYCLETRTVAEWMRYFKISTLVMRSRINGGASLQVAATTPYSMHEFANQPLLGKIVADLKAEVPFSVIMKAYHINQYQLSVIREYYL